MKTSQNGIALIKHYEGLKLEAYLCPANVPTIGIGTTMYPNAKQVRLGDKCTEEEAEKYLIHDLSFLEKRLSSHFKILNQNQFDALISLTYNIGFGNLLASTLRKKILQNMYDSSIGIEWMKWVFAKKVKLPGLIKRRKSEYTLYSTGKLILE